MSGEWVVNVWWLRCEWVMNVWWMSVVNDLWNYEWCNVTPIPFTGRESLPLQNKIWFDLTCGWVMMSHEWIDGHLVNKFHYDEWVLGELWMNDEWVMDGRIRVRYTIISNSRLKLAGLYLLVLFVWNIYRTGVFLDSLLPRLLCSGVVSGCALGMYDWRNGRYFMDWWSPSAH